MPEPLANRREVDARLEQVDRRGMAQRMRVEALLLQGARRGGARDEVLVEQIADAEARELAPAPVREQRRVGGHLRRGRLRQLTQSGGGRGPDRAEPHLASFAAESDLIGRLGADIAQGEIEHLLDTRPRIEHQREQRIR